VSLPYYPMYPKDFESGAKVRPMNFGEKGRYIELLNYSWLNDGLPAEPEMIRRILRDGPEFEQAWAMVGPCFPVAPDGKRRNPRQEIERAKATRLHQQASEAGKRSAEARRERTFHARSTDVRTKDERGSNFVRTPASGSGSMSGSFSESGKEGESEGKETQAIEVSVAPIIEELDEIYRKAGAPIPERHKQVASQLLLAIPPERRARVPNYCKWALVSGKWPSPAKTKALLNVLRDGDWDVEIAPRILPMPASARQLAQERAAEKFRRMP
jgi:hypothetical protein